ncbi:hypothetical protein IQ255_15770 [Pleurocapsales cyanobacterium LEGE 10410]|nr:hypothetical protein [Pleurocapsales cyanobacterium LEGE 10410]
MSVGITKYGNSNNNTLEGYDGDDTLYGYGGNDSLYGYDGSDWLYGHDGDDVISGHDGDDYLFGGEGKDILFGDSGNDFFWGGSGWDKMGGSAGDDIMYGSSGNDVLLGGGDNDRLYGSDSTAKGFYEIDELTGNQGADVFVLGTQFGGGGAWYTADGEHDYAYIQDFNRAEGDKIQVFGSASDYTLTPFGDGMDINYQGELIGYVANTTNVIIPEDFTFV